LSRLPVGFPFADDEPCLGAAVLLLLLLLLRALRKVVLAPFFRRWFFQRRESTFQVAVYALNRCGLAGLPSSVAVIDEAGVFI
jgi:hypothetical protein